MVLRKARTLCIAVRANLLRSAQDLSKICSSLFGRVKVGTPLSPCPACGPMRTSCSIWNTSSCAGSTGLRCIPWYQRGAPRWANVEVFCLVHLGMRVCGVRAWTLPSSFSSMVPASVKERWFSRAWTTLPGSKTRLTPSWSFRRIGTYLPVKHIQLKASSIQLVPQWPSSGVASSAGHCNSLTHWTARMASSCPKEQ